MKIVYCECFRFAHPIGAIHQFIHVRKTYEDGHFRKGLYMKMVLALLVEVTVIFHDPIVNA